MRKVSSPQCPPLSLIETKKAELPKFFFGSSAIFNLKKIRRFPPPSHGGFGFVEKIQLILRDKNSSSQEKCEGYKKIQA
jgi:hypothetical protein